MFPLAYTRWPYFLPTSQSKQQLQSALPFRIPNTKFTNLPSTEHLFLFPLCHTLHPFPCSLFRNLRLPIIPFSISSTSTEYFPLLFKYLIHSYLKKRKEATSFSPTSYLLSFSFPLQLTSELFTLAILFLCLPLIPQPFSGCYTQYTPN